MSSPLLEGSPIPPTIEWMGDHIRLIDQRRLPEELVLVEVEGIEQLCELIVELAIRGAPALGAAGAMGIALASVQGRDAKEAASQLKATRPTAVNLAWGVDRALAAADPVAEAVRIAADDVAVNQAIGAHGTAVVPDGARVLTHCNTGSLACVGWGTALGVIRSSHEAGRNPSVWVDETRPVLQGSRLTAWELQQLGIPATLVVDSMAGSLMAAAVDLAIVGADRIAANGDVANKIGTYSLAVLAQYHNVPFYVAAPTSTIDPATPSGSDRGRVRPNEVVEVGGGASPPRAWPPRTGPSTSPPPTGHRLPPKRHHHHHHLTMGLAAADLRAVAQIGTISILRWLAATRTSRSSGSEVTISSPWSAIATSAASMASDMPQRASSTPASRPSSSSNGTVSTARKARASRAWPRVPPRHTWAMTPPWVFIGIPDCRARSNCRLISRSPFSRAISAPASRMVLIRLAGLLAAAATRPAFSRPPAAKPPTLQGLVFFARRSLIGDGAILGFEFGDQLIHCGQPGVLGQLFGHGLSDPLAHRPAGTRLHD